MNQAQANRCVKMIELIEDANTKFDLYTLEGANCGSAACVAGWLPAVDRRVKWDDKSIPFDSLGIWEGASDGFSIHESLGIDLSLAWDIYWNDDARFGKRPKTQKKRVVAALKSELEKNGFEIVEVPA